MGADNYENLGFQVKIDGATDAVNHLQNIIDRLERINKLQGKKISVSKQVVNAQKQEEKQTKRNTQSLTSYFGKLTSTVVIARKFARVISSAIQESANYVENLNLFAVAYRDVYQETLGWALDIADGFGLASNEVLKFAGTFRQLSTSLGLVEDTANSVSKTVTQLGYDMSALFNTSVENAMEKLQSGLFSGNVRPLRAYGIDISQNQIDALFETNQALASLGVNARQLSQSDKVLARLIITLRDGSNAFGTMNREINTLQSQIRILQGSFSNFKLAIGDLVQEPIRQCLIYLNAFIIATTNIIRLFKPLKTTDENNVFTSTAMGAEEASEAIDNLNGQLADFDKFNVLGGQSKGGSQLAVTEALTAELEKQQKLYQEQVDAMSAVTNEATAMAKKILDWFVVVDENGKFVEWTENAKSLGAAIGVIAVVLSTKMIASIGSFVIALFSAKNAINGVWLGVSLLTSFLTLLIAKWDDLSGIEKAVGILGAVASAALVAAAAISAFHGAWTMGTATVAIISGLTAITAAYQLFSGNLKGFADGGYTNANLIMTHENGKREWVGKAAGSSAIVNDTQMSDIMEVAVAKGVYNALSARSSMGGNAPTNETIVVKIGEEAVFNAVRKTARRQGRDFANV